MLKVRSNPGHIALDCWGAFFRGESVFWGGILIECGGHCSWLRGSMLFITGPEMSGQPCRETYACL